MTSTDVRSLLHRRRPLWGLILAPILAFIALGAWALASPVGASPDDDFHLTSIWCATGNPAYCAPGEDETTRVVPEAVGDPACFAFLPEQSAACQNDFTVTDGPSLVTGRGNFAGGYPLVYYAVMSVFVGPDVAVSVVAMRLFNVALFVGLATALYLLLPVAHRPSLVWGWVITTMPLGLFVLSSNNPSSWAVMGIGFGWIALLAYYESSGWRKIVLGALFVLCAVMAAGSRSDATAYLALAVVAVIVLTARKSWRYALETTLPVVTVALCVALFRSSRGVNEVTGGLTPDLGIGEVFSRVALNLIEVPSIWTGTFGQSWGLGWLDTSMPAFVWLGGLAAFLAIGFVASGVQTVRKLIVVVGGALVLMLLPTAVLVLSGSDLGTDFQPRYLLPLVVLFAGVLLLGRSSTPIHINRVQRLVVIVVLSATQFVALHVNIRRYVTGIDELGPNLNAGLQWWWDAGPSPLAVWLVGSLAYAALLTVVLRNAPADFPRAKMPVESM